MIGLWRTKDTENQDKTKVDSIMKNLLKEGPKIDLMTTIDLERKKTKEANKSRRGTKRININYLTIKFLWLRLLPFPMSLLF